MCRLKKRGLPCKCARCVLSYQINVHFYPFICLDLIYLLLGDDFNSSYLGSKMAEQEFLRCLNIYLPGPFTPPPPPPDLSLLKHMRFCIMSLYQTRVCACGFTIVSYQSSVYSVHVRVFLRGKCDTSVKDKYLK